MNHIFAKLGSIADIVKLLGVIKFALPKGGL